MQKTEFWICTEKANAASSVEAIRINEDTLDASLHLLQCSRSRKWQPVSPLAFATGEKEEW